MAAHARVVQLRLSQAVRLLRTRDFERVYRQGRRRRSPHFVLIATPNQLHRTRFGLSVQARLGGAVVRNRIKRRVREILRRHRPEKPRPHATSEAIGWDVVVQPLSAEVAAADFAALSEELTRLVETSLTR